MEANFSKNIGKVFISYAREDGNIALQLYRDLKSEGVEPWIDKENLLPGQDWKKTIAKSISESSYFIALLSSNSVTKRGYFQKELRIAFEVLQELPPTKIFIIPVRIEECDALHDELKDLHWADLYPSYNSGLKKIIAAIQLEKSIGNREQESKKLQKGSTIFSVSPNFFERGEFYGRQNEIHLLEKWILENILKVIGIVGMGGIGKTTLAFGLAQRISDKFDYVIQRTLINALPAEAIVQDIINVLSSDRSSDLLVGIDKQIELMIDYFASKKCLVLFDSVDGIIKSGHMAGVYRDGYETYQRLFSSFIEYSHKSCLVFTSRIKPLEISLFEEINKSARTINLGGLSIYTCQEILSNYNLCGSDDDIKRVISSYGGNPLAIRLVADFIQSVFNGSISSFLKESRSIFVTLQDLIESQFDQLSDVEKVVIYKIGMHRGSMPLSILLGDTESTKSQNQILNAIQSLSRRSLIIQEKRGFSLPPILIEYINQRMIERLIT